MGLTMLIVMLAAVLSCVKTYHIPSHIPTEIVQLYLTGGETPDETFVSPEREDGSTGILHTTLYSSHRGRRYSVALDDEFVVAIGAKTELKCNIFGHAIIDLKWIRADNSSLPPQSVVQDGTLYIENTQPSAAGEYHCQGVKNGNIIFTVTAKLRVIAPPRITFVLSKQAVRPGENVSINCQAEGEQPIDIMWLAVGRDLPTSAQVNGGQLKFYGIQVTDAGRYMCIAKNSAGEDEALVKLVVNEQ